MKSFVEKRIISFSFDGDDSRIKSFSAPVKLDFSKSRFGLPSFLAKILHQHH